MITPAQAKAARALLGWSQEDLAERSGVVRRTLMSFETGTGNLRQETVEKIVQAFERAGVTFVNRSDMLGVLLRSRR
jgi:transcriptional regulator with XRE-family HTH domain